MRVKSFGSFFYTSLDVTLASLSVNDAGQIVAVDYNGNTYLLTPVPEPRSLALIVPGAIGYACFDLSRCGALLDPQHCRYQA